MRPQSFAPIALSVACLLAAPAAASTPGFARQDMSSQRTANAKDATEEAVQRLVASGARATAEDLDRLAQALRQSLADARSRERIQMAIAELQEQAKQGKLTEQRVRALATDVEGTRLQEAIAELRKKAEARMATAAEVDHASRLLAARQQVAKGTPLEMKDGAQRLAEAIGALRAEEASKSPSLRQAQEVELDAIVLRLQAAFEWLAQQAAARGATRADFARARDLLASMARQAQDPTTTSLAQRLQSALEQIETRAMSGEGVTREELLALRDQMISRAREASAPR